MSERITASHDCNEICEYCGEPMEGIGMYCVCEHCKRVCKFIDACEESY